MKQDEWAVIVYNSDRLLTEFDYSAVLSELDSIYYDSLQGTDFYFL